MAKRRRNVDVIQTHIWPKELAYVNSWIIFRREIWRHSNPLAVKHALTSRHRATCVVTSKGTKKSNKLIKTKMIPVQGKC